MAASPATKDPRSVVGVYVILDIRGECVSMNIPVGKERDVQCGLSNCPDASGRGISRGQGGVVESFSPSSESPKILRTATILVL
jgi:hypothetical protein